MTTRFLTSLQTVSSIVLLLLAAGCDEPTPKADQLTPPSLKNEAVESDQKKASPSEGGGAKNFVEKKPEVKTPEHPYFYIYKEGEKIVIEGALKSKLQIEDIGREMEIFFPELKIENRLKRETHRHAVGWGNRVGSSVLGEYFEIVNEPAIKYEGGVVTLQGAVKNSGLHRKVTELAITAFTDTWTDDLVNEITVGE